MKGIVFALLAGSPQDVASLIEDLGSEAIAVREDAAARLVDLGSKVIPELEKAAKSRDLEVAGRAKVLVGRIRIREKLSPALIKAIPTIDLRLLIGEKETWTVVFWEALEHLEKGNLETADLDRLIGPAIRGARLGTQKRSLCQFVGAMELRSAVPELDRLLKDTNGDVRTAACRALGRVGGKGAASAIVPLLKDRYLYARGEAATTLGMLKADAAAPDLVALLGDRQPYVRGRASRALEGLGAGALPALDKAIADSNEAVKNAAVEIRKAIVSRDNP